MKKATFTAKTAKSLRINSSNEGKGMNHAIKAVKSVWDRDSKDAELQASIDAAKADGLTVDDFSAAYILENLAGTKWVNGTAILMNKKGAMVPKSTWTPGQVIDYVRRANAEKIRKENKSEKASKSSK